MAARVYGIDEAWKSRLDKWRGVPRGNLRNVCFALRHAPEWNGVLATNELTHYINAVKPTPWGSTTRSWSDLDDLKATEWVQAQEINAGSAIVREAIHVIASENSYHPVQDYLEGLKWDQEPRIDNWLRDFCQGNPDPSPEYVSAVGAKWLISACARACRPGCQVDTCLIMQGGQGAGKSSAFRILAGDEWFADQLSNVASKDASMQTRVWIMELAEFDVALRSDPASLKAFLTRRIDHFRPPYGHRVIDVPRHCVFAGTVNDSKFLQDATGGRRFWPVKVGEIHREWLAEERDQLWAEAYWRYRWGEEEWWLDRKLESEAREAQAERYEADIWTEAILNFCRDHTGAGVTPSEVLTAIGKESSSQNMRDNKRVRDVLVSLGWKEMRPGARGSKRPRRWFPENDEWER